MGYKPRCFRAAFPGLEYSTS